MGRMIDADALKEQFRGKEGDEFTVFHFYDAIDDMPTIEERKKGRWVLAEMGDTDLYECSLCRNRKKHATPFCDICGAKMEGAEE